MQRLLLCVGRWGFERGPVAEGGVQPAPVVEHLDVLGDGEATRARVGQERR
jgi:hypothetical protein